MTGQKSFRFKTWGGKRKGAGRKPKGEKAGVSHEVRPVIRPDNVVHVTLKPDAKIGYLRKREPRRLFNWALSVVGERKDFRICHISIQGNHVHLLCEADHKAALSNGMRAFLISVTRGFNGSTRRGCLFPDRYHARVIRTPRQLRNTLNYVFGNWRHHGFDRDYGRCRFDPYSSAVAFPGFHEMTEEETQVIRIPPYQALLRVAYAKSWLLREGWRKGGGPISCWDIPGSSR
jgi:REP element-mobilizing transposase RayT